MRKFPIAIAALLMFSAAAHAQCTPSGMAQFHAADARVAALKTRINAGDCSLIPAWRSALAAVHAILRRSQQQTYPYTCTVTIKYPPTPSCGGNRTAQAPPAKTQVATPQSPPPGYVLPGDTSKHWRGTSDPADCANANSVERSSAAWGTMCVPGGNPARQSVSAPQSASCGDITGTSSGGAAATSCNNGNSLVAAARAVRAQNPAIAAATYRQAADAYRRAGDVDLANKIQQEGQSLVVASAPNPPAAASGASQAPPPPAPETTQQAALPADQPSAAAEPSWCPPATPPSQWQPGHADYCANANCVERGHALYNVWCTSGPGNAQGAADEQNAGGDDIGDKVQKRFSEARRKYPHKTSSPTITAVADQMRALIHAIERMSAGPDRDAAIAALRKLAGPYGLTVDACGEPRPRIAGRLQDRPLRWDLSNIVPEAIERSGVCDGAADLEACQTEKYGEAVMWAEPEIAGQCRAQEAPNVWDTAAVAECAERKFRNAWAHGGVLPPFRLETVNPANAPCQPVPTHNNTPVDSGLRQQLIDLLGGSPGGGPTGGGGGTTTDDPPPKPTETAEDPQPVPEENDAYCSAIADKVRRGELNPGATTGIPPECRKTIAELNANAPKNAVPGFSMAGSETDAAVKKLLEPKWLPTIPDRIPENEKAMKELLNQPGAK